MTEWLQHVNWEFTVGVVLGIAGFGIGVYHIVDLRKAIRLATDHADRLAIVTDRLSDVQEELSTKYIGEFPYFISTIVNLLESATRQIEVFCDYPGYGYFSDPAASLKYKQVLDAKKTVLELSLTCVDKRTRDAEKREQFDPADWSNWRADPGRSEKVRKFIATHAIRLNPETATYEEIMEAMEQIDSDLINGVFGPKRTHEIHAHFPLFFWIVDGTAAIFAIPTLSKTVIEYGFKTSDRTLIEALQLIPGRYQRASETHDKGSAEH